MELESLLPITGSRYAVHLMPSYTEAWVTGPQAASINKQRLLEKYQLLEGYTGFDLASGRYGDQSPHNATAAVVPVPLLSSYTPREQPTKPPVIPGHTAHSSLSLLHKRLHADEAADFNERISVILPLHTNTPSELASSVPSVPSVSSVSPAPTSQYVNLRVVPERVVASLAYEGEGGVGLGQAWRARLALARMLAEDQLLPSDSDSDTGFGISGSGSDFGSGFGSGSGAGSGIGSGRGEGVEWLIAQYEYAPLKGGGTGRGKEGRQNEVWVVLDATNPRIHAAVAHERRNMNRINVVSSSNSGMGNDGGNGNVSSKSSNGSLVSLHTNQQTSHRHPRSVIV